MPLPFSGAPPVAARLLVQTPLTQFSIRIAAFIVRWSVRAALAVLLLLALAWGVLHWFIVPRIDDFRPRLESLASRAIAAPVTIGEIRAESNALVPSVSLHGVQVHDPSGRAGLRVPRVLASFSVLSLAAGGLTQLVIDQPELEIRRTADGRLLAGGIDLSGGDAAGGGASGAADWFFSQHEFVVRGGLITWIDDKRAAPPVSLHDVQLVVRNGPRRHQLRIDATPQDGWGERFTLIGQFRQPVLSRHAGQWGEWSGQVFADLPGADVSRLRQYADLKTQWGVDVRAGQGALRAWADVRRGAVVAVTADLALGAVAASFGPDLQPLAFGAVSGRISWRNQPGVMDFDTRDLHFVDADGTAWPGGNFAFNYRDGQGALAAGGQLRGEHLDLAALSKIASRLPLPAGVHERLAAHPVRGLVESLDARWDGPLDAPRGWRVQARLTALAVGAAAAPPSADGHPAAGVPGIEGAALTLEAAHTGGQATLEVRDGALEFPGVFEEPRITLDQLALQARWRVHGERIEVDVDSLKLANADAAGSFKAHWHTFDVRQPGDARFPGVINMTGALSRASGTRVHRYLPLVIPASARHYVRDAISKGDARDVTVRLKGDLREVPYEKHPATGEFHIAGPVSGVTMAYVPASLTGGQQQWPALQDVAGELVFDRGGMQVRNARAGVQGQPGWQFPRVQVEIADFGHARVAVNADGRGALAAALEIVRRSPVGGYISHALDQASATGDAALQLRLDLPVDHIHESKVDGRVTLQGNDLRITPEAPLLGRAQGTVSFSDSGFAVPDARVRLLGGDARVSGGTQTGASGTPAVVLRASGNASAEALRQMSGWDLVPAIARQASGSADYIALIGFRAAAPDVLVTSDLRGMAFDLPAPLAKSAGAAMPLRLELRAQAVEAGQVARQRLRLTVADQLALDYELDTTATPARVLRGAFGLGAPAAAGLTLPPAGVQARVQLPLLQVDAWQALTDSLPGGGARPGYLPNDWSLHVDELLLGDRALHDVAASGTRSGGVWRADVQARELAGRIEYSEGAAGRPGKVQARLARLSIPASVADADPDPDALLGRPSSHIPALDIVAEEFELRDKKLGRLEIDAVNHEIAPARAGSTAGAQEWRLSRLALHTPEADFSASGQWAAQSRATERSPRAGARHTELDFKLDIRDGGALLARLGMPGVLARGKGQIEGSIGWNGSPMSPHYPSMSGKLHLDVGAGQFLKAEPGISKLLGVLSLQALPRRLTLDFRDVFSTGFAFDFIRGDVGVQSGVASTNNLQMKGVSAAVLMEGSADIDKETQDLRVVVVPEIDASTAALATAVINPAVGIGAFIAQLVLKRPLAKAATRQFHVGGSWDDPQVEQIHAAKPGVGPQPAEVPAGANAATGADTQEKPP